jgi:hypothetical protein
MKSAADLQRLRDIESEQASCIHRLVELRREEAEILTRVPTIYEKPQKPKRPMPSELKEILRQRMVLNWQDNSFKEKMRETLANVRKKGRLKYFQPGRE